ncbi:response regulator transcription factor [Cryptosporangium minutisporangium]|uniref:Response regulator transcription factor n=1 Tax=Cryptosporangium minutisporangium TaxID=113569 RepID=A0ABP6TDQ3_9ACTN
MTIRVLIADDHPVFRRGLRSVLDTAAGIEVVGEAADGAAAIEAAIQLTANVVLMDLHMPGLTGIDATRALARDAPQIAVLVLTMLENDESLFTALRAGARGYLVKGAEEERVIRAIHAVVDGDLVLGPGIAERALAYFANAGNGSRAARPFPELTDREVEILRLMAQGLTNIEIARRLHLSDKTVRNYTSAVFTKLHVEHRAQAIIRAHQSGLGLPPSL